MLCTNRYLRQIKCKNATAILLLVPSDRISTPAEVSQSCFLPQGQKRGEGGGGTAESRKLITVGDKNGM